MPEKAGSLPGAVARLRSFLEEADIPWDEIAFRTVKETLECFFADRRKGSFGFHNIDIT